jgi:hypothetical protein
MTDPKDRRTEERFPVTADTSCSFLSPVVENFGTAVIQNVSMQGIGLRLSRRIEPGALLAVGLSTRRRASPRRCWSASSTRRPC